MKRYRPPKSSLFVREKGVDLERLQVSDEAYYSITRPVHAKRIEHILQHHLNDIGKRADECTLTDATACVGGDSIHFSRWFKHVHAVEINPEHCRMLQNNVDVYRRSNVTVHCKDCVKVLPQLKQDVLFLDPPWGGPTYKSKKKVWLTLSGIPLHRLVQQLVTHTALMMLKVPVNYDVSKLLYKPNATLFQSLHVYHLDKMNIIVIVTKPTQKTVSPRTAHKKHTRKLM